MNLDQGDKIGRHSVCGFELGRLIGHGCDSGLNLFGIEPLIWWIPYLKAPTGRWRVVHNRLLALATSDFEPGDTLARWQNVYDRLHRGTITLLPPRDDRPIPNLEHTILHGGTLLTALVAVVCYHGLD
jgi:hypothetical protein